jgi:hypothetical protein
MVDRGDGADRALRLRARLGVLAVAVGCYLAGAPAQRARTALDFTAHWWPWGLLGLAAVNLLRSAVPRGGFIGPAALSAAALTGLMASYGPDHSALPRIVLPGVLALCGAGLVLGTVPTGGRSAWGRFLTTGRVVVPAETPGTLTLRAVLGELRADLRHMEAEGWRTVHVTAVVGHVQVTVPRECTVRMHTSGSFLTRIQEARPSPESGPPEPSTGLTIHVLGVCGAVGVFRA